MLIDGTNFSIGEIGFAVLSVISSTLVKLSVLSTDLFLGYFLCKTLPLCQKQMEEKLTKPHEKTKFKLECGNKIEILLSSNQGGRGVPCSKMARSPA